MTDEPGLCPSLTDDEIAILRAQAEAHGLTPRAFVERTLRRELATSRAEGTMTIQARADDDDLPEIPDDPTHPHAWGRPITLNAEQTKRLREQANKNAGARND